ncbi:MAG: hypothetical protein PHI52_05525 [Bacteroidales bacterium]|nr:hypothetical protein [Bacteroidales bacterium]
MKIESVKFQTIIIILMVAFLFISCHSYKNVPRRHPHRCHDCPTFSLLTEKQLLYASVSTKESGY